MASERTLDHYLYYTMIQHVQLAGCCVREIDDPVAFIGSTIGYLHNYCLVVMGIGHLQQSAERIGAVCTGEAVSMVGDSI